MGQHLAKLVLLSMPLGGCSLIYSSDRLPALNDAPPADVEPMKLTLERVTPTVLLEGQGIDGSRPALLIIYGTNIVTGATVTVTHHPGDMNASLTVDSAAAVVDAYGQSIAVPITLNVDRNIGPSQSIRLDVTVTQPSPYTDIRATLGDDEDPVLTLQGLPELEGTPTLPTDAPHLFSSVNVMSIDLSNRTNPLIVRSTSSIQITGMGPHAFGPPPNLDQEPGPGGNRGGDGGRGVVGAPGLPGGGMGGGLTGGGGGGFATRGHDGEGANTGGQASGEAELRSWGAANRGSGGAGGNGPLLNVKGGNGGGSGGSVEFTAAGDMMITGEIQANGGNGTTSNGSSGGGGSGGAVLLRAGGSLSVGGVKALGGKSPQDPDPKGDGASGRVRFDSPDRSATVGSDPAVGYRGPMFAATTPMIVREPQPQLTLVGQPGALIKYTIEDGEGETRGPFEITVSGIGEAKISLAMPLFRGYNRLCALVTGVTARRDEAENCITLAYLY